MNKKRKVLSVVTIALLLLFCFVFVACSNSMPNAGGGGQKVEGSIVDTDVKISTEGTPTRKIIYNASVSLLVDDVAQGFSSLNEKINSDEWVESSSVNANNARIVVRVKSDRIIFNLAKSVQGIQKFV